MISLKAFLDGLADDNHPFRKGPGLAEGSILSLDEMGEPAKVPAQEISAYEEQQMRFYFMRLNKN